MRDHSQSLKTLTKNGIPRWANLMSVIIILTVIDFTATFSRHPKLQYIIVVIPISYLLLSNFSNSHTYVLSSLSFFSGLLWVMGITGIYWGKIVERNTDGALPLIWPLAILMFASYRIESNKDVKKGIVILAYLSNVISLEGIIVRLFELRGIFNYSHEKAFLIFFAIAVGVIFKKKSLALISIVLLIANFIVYPAFTYFLCGLVACFVAVIMKRPFKLISFFVLQALSFLFLYYSTFLINQPYTILDPSYKLLGRSNNIAYREFLIREVRHAISENFWFGSFFRRSVLVEIGKSSLPVHNDFVTITLGGGVISLILYLSIYLVTNYNLLGRVSKVLDDDSSKALICLGVLVNCYFYCSAANPISMKPQNGMILMSAIYSIKVILSSTAIPRK